jgi:FlgD Ig-like domain
VDASRVYVGGDFRMVGVAPHSYFAAIVKPSAVGVDEPALTKPLRLFSSPNPFTHTSALRFTLQRASEVSLTIYDVSGRLVRELEKGRRAHGPHRFAWDGRDRRDNEVEPGIYFVKLTAGMERETAKIVKLQ